MDSSTRSGARRAVLIGEPAPASPRVSRVGAGRRLWRPAIGRRGRHVRPCAGRARSTTRPARQLPRRCVAIGTRRAAGRRAELLFPAAPRPGRSAVHPAAARSSNARRADLVRRIGAGFATVAPYRRHGAPYRCGGRTRPPVGRRNSTASARSRAGLGGLSPQGSTPSTGGAPASGRHGQLFLPGSTRQLRLSGRLLSTIAAWFSTREALRCTGPARLYTRSWAAPQRRPIPRESPPRTGRSEPGLAGRPVERRCWTMSCTCVTCGTSRPAAGRRSARSRPGMARSAPPEWSDAFDATAGPGCAGWWTTIRCGHTWSRPCWPRPA